MKPSIFQQVVNPKSLHSNAVQSFRYDVFDRVVSGLMDRSEHDFKIHLWLRELHRTTVSLRRAGEISQ